MQRRGLLAATLATIALPRLGFTAPNTNEDFRLGVNWGGMHVADLALGYQPAGPDIGASLNITSRGMASMLTSYGGQMSSTCRDLGDRLVSVHHKASFESRRYTRDIEIAYDAEGNPTDVLLLKRGEPQSVSIPRELWQNTVDPLTGILRVRRWIVAGDRPVEAIVPIFDGRSRYDIVLSALPEAGGVARAKLVIKPLASASRSSWIQSWEDDDGRWIEARVSNDSRAVPILIETQDGGTASSIELDQDCSNGAACS